MEMTTTETPICVEKRFSPCLNFDLKVFVVAACKDLISIVSDVVLYIL